MSIIYDNKGKIVSSSNNKLNEVQIELITKDGLDYDNEIVISSPDEFHYDVENNKETPKPPRPDSFHDFDYNIKEWVINQEKFKKTHNK